MMTLDMIMSTDLVTITPRQTLAEARSLMHDRKINALLVVDDDRRVQGAFNMQDLLRAGVV